MMSKLYKTFNIVIFFGVLFQFLKSDSVLSDRYHTYAEIDSILHQWDQEFGGENNPNSPYPNSGTIFKLIDLGVSTQDELPFWAVKLSFNADIDEDEPRVLILGQCHAEEILGVEISMDLIYRFLHPSEYPAEYQTLAGILYSSEVWIVPTYNPEGLEVVHGWQDDDFGAQDDRESLKRLQGVPDTPELPQEAFPETSCEVATNEGVRGEGRGRPS